MVISGIKDLQDRVELGNVRKELVELIDLIDKLDTEEITNG
jgi:hypothetical protein